jgi:D-tagatose-1,6-bisphosphate aldolase subunit GatZ/KbaZ
VYELAAARNVGQEQERIMWSSLDKMVRRQKAGEPGGMASVCSAHPPAIEAAVLQTCETGRRVLEAASDQVDQYGGYTGMRPDKEYS